MELCFVEDKVVLPFEKNLFASRRVDYPTVVDADGSVEANSPARVPFVEVFVDLGGGSVGVDEIALCARVGEEAKRDGLGMNRHLRRNVVAFFKT